METVVHGKVKVVANRSNDNFGIKMKDVFVKSAKFTYTELSFCLQNIFRHYFMKIKFYQGFPSVDHQTYNYL